MDRKEKFERILKRIKHPRLIRYYIIRKFLTRFFSDEKYLRIQYKARFGKKLNLDNPITYNEKIQWLKLYNHNPLYTKLVNKIEVKEYLSPDKLVDYAHQVQNKRHLHLSVSSEMMQVIFLML